MNEQAPQYHSSIEDAFETTGPDMGRVKDESIAYDVAEKAHRGGEMTKKLVEKGMLDAAVVEKQRDEIIDADLKAAVARKAVDAAADNLMDNITAVGIYGEDNSYPINDPAKEVQNLVNVAKEVSSDYDRLQNDAKTSRREKNDL
jgi:hypothetical protein